jgi:hypothetical protein
LDSAGHGDPASATPASNPYLKFGLAVGDAVTSAMETLRVGVVAKNAEVNVEGARVTRDSREETVIRLDKKLFSLQLNLKTIESEKERLVRMICLISESTELTGREQAFLVDGLKDLMDELAKFSACMKYLSMTFTAAYGHLENFAENYGVHVKGMGEQLKTEGYGTISQQEFKGHKLTQIENSCAPMC